MWYFYEVIFVVEKLFNTANMLSRSPIDNFREWKIVFFYQKLGDGLQNIRYKQLLDPICATVIKCCQNK